MIDEDMDDGSGGFVIGWVLCFWFVLDVAG